jgi:hypothetical protein
VIITSNPGGIGGNEKKLFNKREQQKTNPKSVTIYQSVAVGRKGAEDADVFGAVVVDVGLVRGRDPVDGRVVLAKADPAQVRHLLDRLNSHLESIK